MLRIALAMSAVALVLFCFVSWLILRRVKNLADAEKVESQKRQLFQEKQIEALYKRIDEIQEQVIPNWFAIVRLTSDPVSYKRHLEIVRKSLVERSKLYQQIKEIDPSIDVPYELLIAEWSDCFNENHQVH